MDWIDCDIDDLAEDELATAAELYAERTSCHNCGDIHPGQTCEEHENWLDYGAYLDSLDRFSGPYPIVQDESGSLMEF